MGRFIYHRDTLKTYLTHLVNFVDVDALLRSLDISLSLQLRTMAKSPMKHSNSLGYTHKKRMAKVHNKSILNTNNPPEYTRHLRQQS